MSMKDPIHSLQGSVVALGAAGLDGLMAKTPQRCARTPRKREDERGITERHSRLRSIKERHLVIRQAPYALLATSLSDWGRVIRRSSSCMAVLVFEAPLQLASTMATLLPGGSPPGSSIRAKIAAVIPTTRVYSAGKDGRTNTAAVGGYLHA
ncbi:predicted protein [Chaetomium globosum CBS 148.51]|uniref:Uncharacterized protein n=1 Tax=Chaetomium globosum (strain ATCC 6205 / CBS 148.51 / DSM 1962 / NBRC 6347 / NRRL 1970) TaxID=306901 RepID=Q2HGN0_CHAGB|nr:uncharacterized protein CHGG_00624 [Chaetomium globosum CBS 148.51]EAQ92389.1 predicted protein [Chaetomium globosum CBS 148.51]